MNKAFVKEDEDPHDRCPACGSLGTTVYAATIRAHLPSEAHDRFVDSAFFCPHPSCEVAYFDQFEQTVSISGLVAPVYPKDPDAAICPCFGFTCREIEDDIDEGVVTRVKAHIERANSDDTHCSTLAVDGKSCVAAVQRYFMKLRGG